MWLCFFASIAENPLFSTFTPSNNLLFKGSLLYYAYIMIDLHTHSTASDGTFTPSQLVHYAASKNIKVLALTDHDTTSGLLEAQEAAKAEGIIFIPGIEVSIDWPTGEFHLLGLGLKELSSSLKSLTDFLKEERKNRNIKMAQRLKEEGVDITFEEVASHFNTENIGRPHFAACMVQKGIIKERQQAFDLYFAKGRPCYVDKAGADLQSAINAIKESGGVPVQAHPLSMYISWGKIEDTLKDIVSKGIMGFEAWHPGIRVAEAERLEDIAHKLSVCATAGSDFHGEKVRADRHIGYTAGKKKIEDRFWEEELMPVLKEVHGNENLEFRI